MLAEKAIFDLRGPGAPRDRLRRPVSVLADRGRLHAVGRAGDRRRTATARVVGTWSRGRSSGGGSTQPRHGDRPRGGRGRSAPRNRHAARRRVRAPLRARTRAPPARARRRSAGWTWRSTGSTSSTSGARRSSTRSRCCATACSRAARPRVRHALGLGARARGRRVAAALRAARRAGRPLHLGSTSLPTSASTTTASSTHYEDLAERLA